MNTQSLGLMPVTSLKGVGPKAAETLASLHIASVQDLLFYLPLRYEDRTKLTRIADVQTGSKALIEGQIVQATVQFGQRRSLLCRVSDETGALQLRFFHFNASQKTQLSTAGVAIRCFGEVRAGYRDVIEMVHPEYRCNDQVEELALSDRLTPVYPTVQGVTQATWRKLLSQALTLLKISDTLTELLPEKFQQKISLRDALIYIHQPPSDADTQLLLEGKHPAQQRLALEELVAQQLGVAQFRMQAQQHQALAMLSENTLQQRLVEALPFTLTSAQQRVIETVNEDLSQAHPMLRLVQGDVGSGKTIVAALALLRAVEQGWQAILMAPTELLAEQHFQSLTQWFSPLGVTVGWLSGRQTDKQRRLSMEAIAGHQVDVVVGTHALFQDKVEFAKLALLVVDEQHRFGVHQRLSLKEKAISTGMHPHQLVMTATPIPRTLAMTAYADLAVSVIDELPPGRQPIKTVLVSNQRRAEIVERIQVNCQQGRQAYWVCTIIEDSETLRAEAATSVCKALKQALPSLNLGLVHGRLKSDEKESIMASFKAGELDLLVATTVIEVGVDVPNASLMVIENAERLGLAQLHQLRGRVGRGSVQSFCVLMYQGPLSKTAKLRLQVMRDHQDGFYIAEQDLKIRGPGELLGTKQTGLLRLRVADLLRDEPMLPLVKAISEHIVTMQSDLLEPLLARWLSGAEQYAEV